MHVPIAISNHPGKTIVETLQVVHVKAWKVSKKSMTIVTMTAPVKAVHERWILPNPP